jgi:hypothetical protein
MMPAMVRIYDPAQLRHPRLREFAVVAAYISTLAESVNDLEDLLVDVPPEERVLPDFNTPWPWDVDSFVVALSAVQHMREAAERGLEELAPTWLGEDPENWPVLRLTVIDPWKELADLWSETTPEWLRTLGTIATCAHVKYDPFGRRSTVCRRNGLSAASGTADSASGSRGDRGGRGGVPAPAVLRAPRIAPLVQVRLLPRAAAAALGHEPGRRFRPGRPLGGRLRRHQMRGRGHREITLPDRGPGRVQPWAVRSKAQQTVHKAEGAGRIRGRLGPCRRARERRDGRRYREEAAAGQTRGTPQACILHPGDRLLCA